MAIKKKQACVCRMVFTVLLYMAVFIACTGEDDIQSTQGEEKIFNGSDETWPEEPTEPAQDGAYLAIGADREFANIGESAVIHEDYLYLFWNGEFEQSGQQERCDVVQFSLMGDSYTGKNSRIKISFKLSGGVLTVYVTGAGIAANKQIQFKRDFSAVFSEEEPAQLYPPENLERFYNTNGSLSSLLWHYSGEGVNPFYPLHRSGILGASVEVKRAGAEDFTNAAILDYYPEPYFEIKLPGMGLTQGTNILKITHLGGLFRQLGDGNIRLSLDSQPLYFNLIVDSEGKISEEASGPTEPAQDGAFFATGRSGEFAVIQGDCLSLFWQENEYCDVVQFSREGDSYMGKSIRADISFKLFGDDLTLTITHPSRLPGTRIMQLIKNPSIKVSEEEPLQILPPENVAFYSGQGFSWGFDHVEGWEGSLFPLRNNGILGAGLEIKYAGAEDFTAVSISDFTGGPVWRFFVYLHHLGLPQGTHIARIKHLGGPFVQWEALDAAFIQRDEGIIRLSVDSAPIYFKLSVDAENNMSAEEISEY